MDAHKRRSDSSRRIWCSSALLRNRKPLEVAPIISNSAKPNAIGNPRPNQTCLSPPRDNALLLPRPHFLLLRNFLHSSRVLTCKPTEVTKLRPWQVTRFVSDYTDTSGTAGLYNNNNWPHQRETYYIIQVGASSSQANNKAHPFRGLSTSAPCCNCVFLCRQRSWWPPAVLFRKNWNTSDICCCCCRTTKGNHHRRPLDGLSVYVGFKIFVRSLITLLVIIQRCRGYKRCDPLD